MSWKTRKATRNTIRYKRNQGFFQHKDYYDILEQFQATRQANQDYSINTVNPPSGYNVVFQDDFNQGNLDNTKWGTGYSWGTFHRDPDSHGFYFPENGQGPTKNSIRVNSNNVLELDCVYDRKEYDVNNLTGRDSWRKDKLLECPDEGGYYFENPIFTIDYNGGAVFSKESWHKGWFEIELKAPVNKHLWTGIWMEGTQHWPPEIDLVEHFTEDDDHWIEQIPNIHTGAQNGDSTSPDWGTKKKGWLSPGNEYSFLGGKKDEMKLFAAPYRFIQYVCHWTNEFVRIYYDGVLFREYSTDAMDALYSDNNQSMRIVLNNGVGNYSKGNMFGDDHPYENSTLYINKVRVFQR